MFTSTAWNKGAAGHLWLTMTLLGYPYSKLEALINCSLLAVLHRINGFRKLGESILLGVGLACAFAGS